MAAGQWRRRPMVPTALTLLTESLSDRYFQTVDAIQGFAVPVRNALERWRTGGTRFNVP